MRLCKIILIVSMLSALNMYAGDKMTYDGDVKLFYSTSDISKNGEETKSIFNKEVSAFDAALRLSISAEPMEGLFARATAYGVSTLGLDNKLADNVWSGAHGAKQKIDGDLVTDDALWLGEAWLAETVYDTTFKLGRMPLDTPLIFTETWDIAPNTFEAAVLKNESLPNTVLVGAWVPRSNGIADDSSTVNLGNTVSKSGDFHTFGEDGAWTVGIVNSTLSWLTLQGWYYDFMELHAQAQLH